MPETVNIQKPKLSPFSIILFIVLFLVAVFAVSFVVMKGNDPISNIFFRFYSPERYKELEREKDWQECKDDPKCQKWQRPMSDCDENGFCFYN